MATAAPSTLTNPLEESYARITGTDPLSTTTGTQSLINYEDLGNRSETPGDVITIQGDPGTGATTAESWAHEIELENQRREALEFEWQQQQQEFQNALEQQQAALSQSQFGLQQAEEKRAAGLYGSQQQAAALANQAARQDIALKAAAEQRAADEMYIKYGGRTAQDLRNIQQANQAYAAFRGGTNPVTTQSSQAWNAALAQNPNLWKSTGQSAQTGASTYQGILQQSPGYRKSNITYGPTGYG